MRICVMGDARGKMAVIANGIRTLGHHVDHTNDQAIMDASDILVTFGHWPARARIRTGKWVHVDYGYVNRSRYLRLSVDALQPGKYISRLDCPDDRWKSLHTELKPWKTASNDEDAIYVCPSSKRDFKYYGTHLFPEWAATEKVLRYHTKRRIVYRKKLGMGAPRPALHKLFPTSHAVVTWTSIAAVEAAIAGVPTFTVNPISAASPVSSVDLTQIERPVFPDREKWAHNLAYQQWTVEELGTGEPFDFLRLANLI